MGSLNLKTTVFLFATFLMANFAEAQTPFLKEVLILSGGEYGNPSNNITLRGLDPSTETLRISDTIYSQSVQDLLIEGDFAYIAAEDSLVKINLTDLSRVAATAFPGPSTNALALYQDQLLVGNFYGQNDSNLYVFNKNTLALEHVVGGVLTGVKGIAIIGDTAYLSQNLTSANYTDSAGYLSLVYLPTGAFVKNVPGDSLSQVGKLFVRNGGLVAFGSGSDNITTYTPTSGALVHQSLGADLEGSYGSTLQIVGDTLFGIFDGKIASYNLNTLSIINASFVDTLVTAFAYDTLSGNFYVTQTDYFSYTRGIVFNTSGSAIDTFAVGAAPEVLKLVYGTTVGITEIATNSFIVYPNPTNGTVWVKMEGQQNTTLLLRDLTGRTLQTVIAETGMLTTIDVSTLAPGLYLLQSSDGKFTQKVVKQ